MKITFNKDLALESIGPLQGVMSTKSMLPILSHIILEAGEEEARMTASDLELWISGRFPARIEEAGSVTIPGRRFFSIIRELPGSEASLESGEDNITKIRCLKSYFQIVGMPREEFPARPDLGKLVKLEMGQGDLKRLIKETSYAISQDETRYVLNGLYLLFKEGKVTAVATDGRRMAMAETQIEMSTDVNEEIILPLKAVQELGRILEEDGMISLQIGSKQIAFQLPHIFLVSRLIDGRFPDYHQVIPSQTKVQIKLPRLNFMQMVKRAALLTSEKSNSVKFEFKPGNLLVTAVTPEVGEAREEMDIDYKGDKLEISFNPLYIIDVMKALDEQEEVSLELIDSSSPGLFRVDQQFICIIMPMKLS